MVQQWCDRIQLSYQSTKDGTSSIYKEEGFKGPEGANPLWMHSAADYQGQRRTPDRELMWKAQPNNVMNKAYRAFWTCSSTSCSTWGLKPRVVQWSDPFLSTAPWFCCRGPDSVSKMELVSCRD